MPTTKQAALMWSGGKDSCLALHHVLRHAPEIRVVKLLTCLSEVYDRVSMHGVRRQLVSEQAEALGLPVDFIIIPHQNDPSCPMAQTGPGTTLPPNDVYSRTMLAAFRRLKEEGVEVVVFGDLYLEDLRAYRDRLLDVAGLVGCYPLWGRDTSALYEDFLEMGFRAVTICVDTQRLPAGCCGKPLDAAFRESLPAGSDPCGERGEYHSFTYDGPIFHHPVDFRLGDVHLRAPFAFQELFAATTLDHEGGAGLVSCFTSSAPIAHSAEEP